MDEIAFWKGALTEKNLIAKDVIEMTVERPAGFSYTAGQFIQFLVPENQGTARRAYSLASHPNMPVLEFCLKILPGGLASTYFKNASPGQEVTWVGPRGRFINEKANTPLSFVATGAGIAPILGIISDELQNKKNMADITLLFGVRSEEDMFWIDRLENLAHVYTNFSFRLTLSQPGTSWNGLCGRVTEHIPQAPSPGVVHFLCGGPDMIKDVRAILLERGVPIADIHIEIF